MGQSTDAASDPTLAIPSAIPSAGAAHQVVPHSALDEARRRALGALEAGASTIALVGMAGTGKTLLLAELASMLRARQVPVVLLRTTHDLLNHRPEDEEDGAIVLLDEADRATDAQLATILGTGPGLASAGRRGTRILAGLSPLLRRLEALRRPAVAVPLAPVPRAELAGFIAARLDAAGYPPDLFTPEAVEELAVRSGGVPRLVNVLTAAAAFAATLDDAPADQAPAVTARHVVEATRHAAGSAQVSRPASLPPVAGALGEMVGHAVPPAAPGGVGPVARPHLVDAAAGWAEAAWPLPEALVQPPPGAAPAALPPEPVAREEQVASAVIPAAVPADRGDEPPALPADELAIPPAPLPDAGHRSMPAPSATTVAGGGLADAPARLEALPPAAAGVRPRPAEAGPPPRRRRAWRYAAAVLLILVGAAVALERSGDAPAGSPLARLAPLRAWIVARTGFDGLGLERLGLGRAATVTAPMSGAPATPPAAAIGTPFPSAPPPAPVEAPRAAATAPPVPPAAGPLEAPPAPAPDAGAGQAGSGAGDGTVNGPPSDRRPDRAPGLASGPASLPTPAPGESPDMTPPPSAAPPAPIPPRAEALVPEAPLPESPLPEGPVPEALVPGSAAPAGPGATPSRLMVHLLSTDPQGASAKGLADLSARFPELVARRGGRGPSFPAVRHFHPADAAAADAIAAALNASGVAARVQDFSAYRPQPRVGTIEVWLP